MKKVAAAKAEVKRVAAATTTRMVLVPSFIVLFLRGLLATLHGRKRACELTSEQVPTNRNIADFEGSPESGKRFNPGCECLKVGVLRLLVRNLGQ
jgi:hypothetical protein